ncbi:MAG: hypothetical protein MJ197_06415 [Bacteroidales bacterium]|nr:hypothetical protein [Bacteroidales bacterium]
MRKLSPYEQECLKYVEAIDCLHKKGYELLRICSSISPSGCSWRCTITPKSNTYYILGAKFCDFKKCIVCGQLNCKDLTPEEIAEKILNEYSEITKDGLGEDSEYMIWYKEVLKAARQGHFPYTEAEYYSAIHSGYVATLNNGPMLPLPPAGEIQEGNRTDDSL